MATMHDEIWASVPAARPIDERAVAWALETVALAGEAPRVLDLGCGDGRVAARLAAAGAAVTGADPSPAALARAREAHPGLDLREIGADGRVPAEDGVFDAVVCLDVLQHVADTQRLMSEARRVLAPRGLFAASVPFHGRARSAAVALTSFERHYDPLEPVLRFYTRRSLARLLAAFGYGEVVVRAAGGVPLFRAALLARARR
jgi:2-polyprenyl-6-hydroxyphenyl methylase/3-demethylubiquinone-9 3-methyltransferase